MGNNQSNEKKDQQRFLDFKDKYTDMGDYQDTRYGKHRIYEENSVGQKHVKEKVVVKTVEATDTDTFNKFLQLLRRREEIRSPHLCRLYGVFDSSEELICGKFHRLTFAYENCTYDLEMDLTNRSRLANNHPDKVNKHHSVF